MAPRRNAVLFFVLMPAAWRVPLRAQITSLTPSPAPTATKRGFCCPLPRGQEAAKHKSIWTNWCGEGCE
ncbi:MAG TPA: hypothetical protein VJY15_05475 [Candidatus Acidoferrum sp.]|nr:hypothetical protein [Candidatus Acidoferrum sp.]